MRRGGHTGKARGKDSWVASLAARYAGNSVDSKSGATDCGGHNSTSVPQSSSREFFFATSSFVNSWTGTIAARRQAARLSRSPSRLHLATSEGMCGADRCLLIASTASSPRRALAHPASPRFTGANPPTCGVDCWSVTQDRPTRAAFPVQPEPRPQHCSGADPAWTT